MKMNQYAYFSLWSATMSAAQISAHLGLDPDEVTVRGSKQVDPPLPGGHSWDIVSRQPGLDLEDLISPLLARIAPVATGVRQLVDSGDVEAQLSIVRYFNDETGHVEKITTFEEDGHQFEKMPGQHQMLGWFVESEALELLASMKATIDVDEYGWPMMMN